jgi:ADP-Ribosyltransferase in polyvalent proteins
MDYYRAIKTIKGHRYVYLQRTWREGRRVRCHCRYMGPLSIRAVGYHGTFAKFRRFSNHAMGSSTKAPDAEEGFFFASNRKVAISYASTELAAKRGLEVTIETLQKRLEDATGLTYWEASSKLEDGDYDDDLPLLNKLKAYAVRLGKAQRRMNDLMDRGIFDEVRLSKRGEVKLQRLAIRRAYYHDMEGTRYSPWVYSEVIEQAKAGDYDGVVIKNTYDGGTPSQWTDESKDDLTDVYIVFDTEQILEEALRLSA